jgi:hypothetical protein
VFETKSAIISPDGRYRYRLDRHTPGAKHKVLWVMLNPSTADHEKDDPTIRKCIGFTERLGFKSLMVGNLATLRTPHPKELLSAMRRGEDITGPDHLTHLKAMFEEATIAIAAWGRHGHDLLHLTGHFDGFAWGMGKQHFNLGRCLNMHPRHPLMVGYDDGLMQMAIPPREFGCRPLEPSQELLTKMLAKMASLRGEA